MKDLKKKKLPTDFIKRKYSQLSLQKQQLENSTEIQDTEDLGTFHYKPLIARG